MFRQIAAKVEELACGVSPERITGSTTVRAATGLIAGVSLNNVEFADEDAWSMLDEIQKRTVVHFRPTSKYADWFENDLIERKLKQESESPQQRAFRQYLERSTEMRYVIEIEMRASLAEAMAVLAKRSSVSGMRPFADDDEEAVRMACAVQEVGSFLKEMGLQP
jgi:hypothetical protein